MVQPWTSPQEVNLLKIELESLGEELSEERIERQLENDHLRLEIEAIKQVLKEHLPEFLYECEKVYQKLLGDYDPELKKYSGESQY